MATIGRRAYAEIFGPTVGDRVRLADTDLLIEVEADYTLRAGGYGEEVKFGGGKTIRDGMAQSQRTRDGKGSGPAAGGANALPVVAGLLAATLLLHVTGMAAGWALRHANVWVPRLAGAGVAVIGVALLGRLA